MSAIGWQGLGDLLAEVRHLKVVAIFTNVWGEDRCFRPLIERYSGLHLCTSMYMLEGGVKDFCRSLRTVSTALRQQLSRLSTGRQPLLAAERRSQR